jgi:hypothetical protein
MAATGRDVCLQNRRVFARLDGAWRVISSQGSLIHDGPLAAVNHDGVTGKYEGGGTYVITETGRTLFGQRSPMPRKSPLFETADGGFEGPLGRWKFTVHKDDKGRVTGLTFSSDGKDRWHAKKIE